MTVKIIEKTEPEMMTLRVPTQVIGRDPIAVKLVEAKDADSIGGAGTRMVAVGCGNAPRRRHDSTGKMTNQEIMRLPYEERRLVLLEDERMRRLEETLLSLGGDRVALVPEPHADMLLERGECWRKRVWLVRMEPNQCHGNTATLWVQHRHRGFQIVTGGALTKDDGCWRQHTWGLDPKENRIIETTDRRNVYFGAMLTDRKAGDFYLQNAPEARRVLEVFTEVIGNQPAEAKA
jgi:hypothetical protein